MGGFRCFVVSAVVTGSRSGPGVRGVGSVVGLPMCSALLVGSARCGPIRLESADLMLQSLDFTDRLVEICGQVSGKLVENPSYLLKRLLGPIRSCWHGSCLGPRQF